MSAVSFMLYDRGPTNDKRMRMSSYKNLIPPLIKKRVRSRKPSISDIRASRSHVTIWRMAFGSDWWILLPDRGMMLA
jgi:hypothetical protein